MGLASKAAAAKANQMQQPGSQYPPPAGQPTYAGQPQYGQAAGGYNPQARPGGPGSQQYQAYQPQQSQQTYNAPPPPSQYGSTQQPPSYPPRPGQVPELPGSIPAAGHAPPPASGGGPTRDPQMIFNVLKETVIENRLEPFYNDASLHQLAQRLVATDPVTKICDAWKIDLEFGFDLVKLALYDIWFLIDDSGSIAFSRLQPELKSLLKSAAFASSLFDQDGFSVRFMNSKLEGENVRTEQQAEQLLDRAEFRGITPLVTSLREKILAPQLGQVHMQEVPRLQKPMLVIIITDGVPTDSPGRAFQDLIRDYKVKPVAFQIAQVGTDKEAQNFLSTLDRDPEVGGLIDCTSNFEMEYEEFKRKTGGEELSRSLWYCKLLLGSIDKSYDSKDEAGAPPPVPPYGGAPPPGQYGAPSPGGYGPPQPGYGQYGQQPGPNYPPPGGAYGGHPPTPGPGQPPHPSPQGYSPYPAPGQPPYGGQFPPQGYAPPPPHGGPPPPSPHGHPPPQQQYGAPPGPPPGYGSPPPPQQYGGAQPYQGQPPPSQYSQYQGQSYGRK